MRKVLMLLTCMIMLLTCLSAFENETLTLSFDIEEGTDSREFGFSPVPLVLLYNTCMSYILSSGVCIKTMRPMFK